MTLDYRVVERGYIVWFDYVVDGEAVKSPVDIDVLPFGVYRLMDEKDPAGAGHSVG